MKKEFVIAILVGLVMGLFITYGIYYSQKTDEQEQLATTIQELEKTPTPDSIESSAQLTIYNPSDESVTADTTTSVTGKTIPNAFITIFVNNKPIITQADETGNFSKTIELQDMSNIIQIYAIEEDGTEYKDERTVIVYDQEFNDSEEAEPETTEEEDVNHTQTENE